LNILTKKFIRRS